MFDRHDKYKMISWNPHFVVITPRALKVQGIGYHQLMFFQIANLMIWINFFHKAIKVRSETAHLWTKDPAGREGEWANNRRLLGVGGLVFEYVICEDFFHKLLVFGPNLFWGSSCLAFHSLGYIIPMVHAVSIYLSEYIHHFGSAYHWSQCLNRFYGVRTVCLRKCVHWSLCKELWMD